MTAWRSHLARTSTGARAMTFKSKEGIPHTKTLIPCGKCIGCKLEKSRQWAMRSYHEAQLHDENCFLTLTYDNEHINTMMDLVPEDMQLFMKRYRKHLSKEGIKIRYLYAGEYGENLARPHYHACIFGHDFHDKLYWSNSKTGNKLYVSALLQKLWPYGYSYVQNFTWDTAAYTARYVTKKITGEKAEEHYQGRHPEFIRMSLKPGIGSDWLKKYEGDVYQNDMAMSRPGLISRPPKYYDRMYEKMNPDRLEELKKKRQEATRNVEPDYDRLEVQERIHNRKATKLKRSHESDIARFKNENTDFFNQRQQNG